MVILHVGGRCLEAARRAVIAITFWAVGEGGLRYTEKSRPRGEAAGAEGDDDALEECTIQ
jgi:hypothetical protein